MPNPITIKAGVVLRLREFLSANGTNHLAIRTPDSIAANIQWILPSADGSTGDEVLATDGLGNLSWAINGAAILDLNNTWTGTNASTNATEATAGGAGSWTTSGGIFAAKKIITSSSIKTGAPTTGTSQEWKLGSAITSGTSALDTTKYVEVEINGALVKLGVVTNS